tara:strand:- start:1088 stop:1405 length:318 start_codon:yes stop_codon:yes gene_type:complete
MNKKEKTLTMMPKCLQNTGKAFIGATGELWPCCWLYSQRLDLEIWAEQNNCDMSDIDMNKYTIQEIQTSKLMTKFNKSFDTPTCKRECIGDSHWTKRGHLTSVEV